MKKLPITLCLLVLLAGCQRANTDDNKTLDYDSLEVSFKASLDGQVWPEGSKIGIIATCTRDDATGSLMSKNPVAVFKINGSSNTEPLYAESDDDKVTALRSDHNFSFCAVYPSSAAGSDVTAIPVSVPATQNYDGGIMNSLTFVSTSAPLSVIPTIDLDMSTMFSILELYIPNDICETPVLKSMKLEPTDVDAFDSYLAQKGTYNAYTGVFTPASTGSSNEIVLNFGDSGLSLVNEYTKVQLVVAPFTIPEGGLSITFTDSNNETNTIPALASDNEVGLSIKAGETYTSYLSTFSDGIIPVNFPVIFPIGYPNKDNTQNGYCNAANAWMSEWVTNEACASATRTSQMWSGQHGIVRSMDQTQAYITWNWDDAINDTNIKHFIETSNTAKYYISTFGVKGIWTGDFFEFFIPVRKFKAGSSLKLSMPIYTRSGPTFWEVLYKDGEDWKSTATADLPAFEGSDVTKTATWAVPFGGPAASTKLDTEQSVSMKFSKAIASGIIQIRVKCVDGSIVSSGTNAVTTGLTAPTYSGTAGSAPFYFWNPGKLDDQSIKIELF